MMKKVIKMPLETHEIETRHNPTFSVIWMHGLGADNQDFIPIVDELNLPSHLAIRFIFPNAPLIPVTINGGYVMRAWYDILNNDLSQREDSQGLRNSQQEIEKLIEKENQRGIATNKIILAGFSQGAAMTLQTGLRYPEKLAGLLCLSGYLPLVEQFSTEKNLNNQTTPIFIAHGLMDDIVPLERAQHSKDILLSQNHNVSWKTYTMGHSVCAEEIKDIALWLQEIINTNYLT